MTASKHALSSPILPRCCRAAWEDTHLIAFNVFPACTGTAAMRLPQKGTASPSPFTTPLMLCAGAWQCSKLCWKQIGLKRCSHMKRQALSTAAVQTVAGPGSCCSGGCE
jgi:hypothetical protein